MRITVKELKQYLKGKPVVVETTTVGAIKKKLNEMQGGIGFGQEFKEQGNVYEITDAEEYQTKRKKKKSDNGRKIHSKGGVMVGQGFKLSEQTLKKLNLTKEGVADLIEGIIKELKKNNEYKNLKFVDRIGGKYQMAESAISEMKNIIWEQNSKNTGKKLFNYINECGCPQAQQKFGGYEGLSQDYQSMMPQIKRTYNSSKGKMNTPKAISFTSKNLALPMEMVQEMFEIQKEAYKMKMEGGQSDKNMTEEKLKECYGKYQGMGEGNMDGMYDEMAEMMDYPMAENIYDDEDSEYMKFSKLSNPNLTPDDLEFDPYYDSDENYDLDYDEDEGDFDLDISPEGEVDEVHSPMGDTHTQSDEELVFGEDYNFESIYSDLKEVVNEITGEYGEEEDNGYEITPAGDNMYSVQANDFSDPFIVGYENGEITGANAEGLPVEVRQEIIDMATGDMSTDVIDGDYDAIG